jgi:hypothetical protein
MVIGEGAKGKALSQAPTPNPSMEKKAGTVGPGFSYVKQTL